MDREQIDAGFQQSIATGFQPLSQLSDVAFDPFDQHDRVTALDRPRRTLQHFLYGDDAARAVLTAAQRRPAGRLSYATDGTPASFADFMDHFARLVGRSRPLHLPAASRPFVQLVVREPHMQMVEMAAAGSAVPRLPGWRPRVTGYREGLAEVVEAWAAEH